MSQLIGGMTSFGKSGGGGRRSAPRDSLPMLAVLMTLGRTRAAVVSDLSCSGIRLSGDDLPSEGELLEIRISNVEAFGTVVWSTEVQCGIAFESALASADVEALRQELARPAYQYVRERRTGHNTTTLPIHGPWPRPPLSTGSTPSLKAAWPAMPATATGPTARDLAAVAASAFRRGLSPSGLARGWACRGGRTAPLATPRSS